MEAEGTVSPLNTPVVSPSKPLSLQHFAIKVYSTLRMFVLAALIDSGAAGTMF